MRYTYFDIKNFKGIDHARLDIAKTPRSRIYSLVGLNESGKTTVLEAINLLTYRESLLALDLPGYIEQDVHDLIPIVKRSNFNDKIVIEAGISLNAADEKQVSKRLKEEHGITLSSHIRSFIITQSYQFKASRIQSEQPKISWTIGLKGKTPDQPKATDIKGEWWQKSSVTIKQMLPRIVYFPNFLFAFPDKIYLENPPSDPEKHRFYKTVLQDVLDAIGENANLEDHVLARMRSEEEFEKKNLDSVLLKMGGHITKSVFSIWDRIFKRPAQGKEIVVSAGTDSRKACFLQLRLKQNNEYYEISERSLGFRWFFAYLLLLQYRGFRKAGPRNVIFLLDEPASNLHPFAQCQLLESFAALPDGCDVIYTTHSHHMINPGWLEGAYVVKNEGLDYSMTDEEYTSRRTLITVHRYRDFAAHHPNQSTYFQPILEVLDYSPAKLENIPDIIMLEGKNDFYTMRFMEKTLGRSPSNFLPGGGSGSLHALIRLYVSWGRKFIALLDSDSEGESQKKRYLEDFGSILEDKLYTLGDINSVWQGAGMERLFAESDLLAIQTSVYPQTTKFSKTSFARAIQELTLTGHNLVLNESTLGNFRILLKILIEKLQSIR